jgi:hypothetical protein
LSPDKQVLCELTQWLAHHRKRIWSAQQTGGRRVKRLPWRRQPPERPSKTVRSTGVGANIQETQQGQTLYPHPLAQGPPAVIDHRSFGLTIALAPSWRGCVRGCPGAGPGAGRWRIAIRVTGGCGSANGHLSPSRRDAAGSVTYSLRSQRGWRPPSRWAPTVDRARSRGGTLVAAGRSGRRRAWGGRSGTPGRSGSRS